MSYGVRGESYSWGKVLSLVVKENSIQEIIHFFPSRKESVLTEKQKQQRSDIFINLKSIEMDGVIDLFLISENDTVRLSDFNMINKDYQGTFNTDLLDDLNRWGIPGVNLSPDLSKLIFNYPIEFYDLVHGPTCIVNMTGENQKILMVDEISREESKPTGYLMAIRPSPPGYCISLALVIQ